jgi:hypothetical protein
MFGVHIYTANKEIYYENQGFTECSLKLTALGNFHRYNTILVRLDWFFLKILLYSNLLMMAHNTIQLP